MNIPKLSSINVFKSNYQNSSNNNNNNLSTNFGLKMSSPLSCDTVSFGAAKFGRKAEQRLKQQKKIRAIKESAVEKINEKLKQQAEELSVITNVLAQEIHKEYKTANRRYQRHLQDAFSPLIKDGSITVSARPKTATSIRQKAASLKDEFTSEKIKCESRDDVYRLIEDISGGRIILNNETAFEGVVKLFKSFLKKGYQVKRIEYHRLPEEDLGNGLKRTFDSVPYKPMEKLKKIIYDKSGISCKNSESPAGYSGVHLTLIDNKGMKHELQIMTKSMHKVKEPEDLLYKVKNGKDVDIKYAPLMPLLSALKPAKEGEVLPEESKKLRKQVFEYTKNAYKDALEHPYEDKPILEAPRSILIYDFNTLSSQMEKCKSLSQ